MFYALVAGPAVLMVYRAINTYGVFRGPSGHIAQCALRPLRLGGRPLRQRILANFLPARADGAGPVPCSHASPPAPLQAVRVLLRREMGAGSTQAPTPACPRPPWPGPSGVQLGGPVRLRSACRRTDRPTPRPRLLLPLAPRHIRAGQRPDVVLGGHVPFARGAVAPPGAVAICGISGGRRHDAGQLPQAGCRRS